MKRRMAIMVLVALTGAAAGASGGEWRMRVHRGGQVDEYALAEIDSVTFYEALPGPMILVPAGTFMMGDDYNYACQDDHEVTLTRDFYLGQHEVTNREYMEALQWAYDNGYVGATPTSVTDNLDGSTLEILDLDDPYCEIQFDGAAFYLREVDYALQNAYPDGYDPSNHPVKKVNWFGMAAYCDWLSLHEGLPRAYDHSDWSCGPDPATNDPYAAVGYRLPTDAEWEYAAQFDDERRYPWGDEDPDCSRANFYETMLQAGPCVGWTSPVGSYPTGHSGLGFWDMGGNAWECCNDWWTCHLGGNPVTDPVGPSSGDERVARGGSWYSFGSVLSCASRGDYVPWFGRNDTAFRVARTANP